MSQDDRPRWSFTWLLRIQRTGRNRPDQQNGGDPKVSVVVRLFPWVVILLLIIAIVVGVWVDLLPR